MRRVLHLYSDKIERVCWYVGDAADRLRISPSQVRLWADAFNIGFRNRHNRRIFTGDDIKKLDVVHHLIYLEKYTYKGAVAKFNQMYGAKNGALPADKVPPMR
jgi:hypothetical protein